MLQTQVQELAQVKVESDSRLPIKVFGTILSNTFYNSDEANWLENPNIVNRFGGITGRPGSFSSTLRQSRIGLAVNGPEVGGAKASGRADRRLLRRHARVQHRSGDGPSAPALRVRPPRW